MTNPHYWPLAMAVWRVVRLGQISEPRQEVRVSQVRRQEPGEETGGSNCPHPPPQPAHCGQSGQRHDEFLLQPIPTLGFRSEIFIIHFPDIVTDCKVRGCSKVKSQQQNQHPDDFSGLVSKQTFLRVDDDHNDKVNTTTQTTFLVWLFESRQTFQRV